MTAVKKLELAADWVDLGGGGYKKRFLDSFVQMSGWPWKQVGVQISVASLLLKAYLFVRSRLLGRM